MAKSLVIVESPAKAKTINKYLGSDFIVRSSVGHIRDLPTSGNKTTTKATTLSTKGLTTEQKEEIKTQRDRDSLVKRMGVDPYHDWLAHYEILPGKEKVVAELKKLAKEADHIYLATDLDREGEAIAWHLKEIIGGNQKRYQRVVFNEITKNAIQQAFKQPTQLNMNRVNAQQARRFLDRVVGFMVSPLLWKKIARGLSAGRVQSVAVKLIVEKEHEIKSFTPEEFWDIKAHTLIAKEKEPFVLEVVTKGGKPLLLKNKKEAMIADSLLKKATFEVESCESKPTQSKPSAPFITSTLQQAASTKLGFGVKKTMMMAQRLYEAGYITYMRTDSTNLSQDAVTTARDYIKNKFGNAYLPKSLIIYSSKSNAQEAHEAIRPSDVSVTQSELQGMDKDAERLYDLIWSQFLSCQMTNAQYDATTVTVKADDFILKAKGRVLRFDGWTRVQKALGNKQDDVILPELQPKDRLTLKELETLQHFTKPPARYTEASLVKELEKQGIGRPSTYASIITTIQDRGYVRVDRRRFFAEKMGEIVTLRLDESFQDLMNYDFTAHLEQDLDQIAEGDAHWKTVLNQFFNKFSTTLEKANLSPELGGMLPNNMITTDIICPTCSRHMGIRTASTGVFLGCEGYGLPEKERCKTTINLMSEEGTINILDEDAETNALRAKKRCPLCETAMDAYIVDETRKLHVCGNNPACSGHLIEKGKFKLKGYDGPLVPCDKCEADMILKEGRFGKYMACTSESCSNTRKLLKNGDIAPPKEDAVHFPELKCTQSDAYFVLRDGASGLFMAASNFPKSRETRAPLVREFTQYKSRISSKFQYLAEAPEKDPDGLLAIIRFSRKNKEHYVRTEIEGKPTGWTAVYVAGKWQVTDKRKKAK